MHRAHECYEIAFVHGEKYYIVRIPTVRTSVGRAFHTKRTRDWVDGRT